MDMWRATYPFSGALFAFRGRRAGLIKVLWHDGIGLCLLTKRAFIKAFGRALSIVPLERRESDGHDPQG